MIKNILKFFGNYALILDNILSFTSKVIIQLSYRPCLKQKRYDIYRKVDFVVKDFDLTPLEKLNSKIVWQRWNITTLTYAQGRPKWELLLRVVDK